MADKEHAEWAANQKARKEARRKRIKERAQKPPAAPAEDTPAPRSDPNSEDSGRVALGQ